MAEMQMNPGMPSRGWGRENEGRRNDSYGSDAQRNAINSIRDATGASIEDIEYELRECDGDVNKATEKLIDRPFTVVRAKKPKATKPQGRGARWTTGRDGPAKPRPTEGMTSFMTLLNGMSAGRSSRGAGPSGQRGRGGKPRSDKPPPRFFTNVDISYHRAGGKGRPWKETKETASAVVVTEEIESTTKTVAPPPPPPQRKDYLEALCGKGKAEQVRILVGVGRWHLRMLQGNGGNDGFVVPKKDLVAPYTLSGWEAASSPPDTPMAAGRVIVTPDDISVDDTKSLKVEPTSDVKPVEYTTAKEVDTVTVEPHPKIDVFPVPMKDIRFTRPDMTPILVPNLPDTLKIESSFSHMHRIANGPLDMSTISYLFGTFEGIVRSATPVVIEPVEKIVPESVQENEISTSMPVIPAQPSQLPPEAISITEESKIVEKLESTSFPPQTIEPEDESSRLSQLPKSTVEYLSSATEAPQQLTVDAFSVSKPSEFRLDVQEVDLSKDPTFISADTSAREEKLSAQLINAANTQRQEPTYVSSIPATQDKPPSRPSIDDATEFTKTYPEAFSATVESQKTEELPMTLDPTEPRPPSHRQRGTIAETSTTTAVMETESAFGISSGPTPTVPSYQSQRHQSAHKLSEKPGPPPVGTGVTSSHSHAPKYTPRSSNGVPPPGPIQNPPVHSVTSLNTSNAANQSLPMVPQVPPFLGPGMVPNPGMPFPTGPFYTLPLQYQHQMYHGMYAAGTYSGFGPPFNHDSVGHPAHASPVGVPPNQSKHRSPISAVPHVSYPLGNTVYDNTNPSSFASSKEKDNMFLSQQQLPHAAFPGAPQPVPRNDASLFYGVHGQAFSQNMRTQFPGGGFAGQFPGAGFVAPPHTYHPPGQQGNNFRLH